MAKKIPINPKDKGGVYDRPGHENERNVPKIPAEHLERIPVGDESVYPPGHPSREDNKAESSSQIADRESEGGTGAKSTADIAEKKLVDPKGKLGKGFTGDSINAAAGANPVGRLAQMAGFFKKNRKKTIGTAVATVAIGGGFVGFGIISGPLKIIHVAQILSRTHFSDQEDASDGRMAQAYRFFRSGGDAGETRVGHINSKLNKRFQADLEKAGLKLRFEPGSIFNGADIDTKNTKNPYYGLSESQVKAKLEERDYKVKSLSIDGKGVVKVEIEKGYRPQKSAIRKFNEDLGYRKLTAAMRARPIAKYGWVTWHPMQKVDRKINKAVIAKWEERRKKRLAGKAESVKIDGTQASQDADGDGNPDVDKDGNKIPANVPSGDADSDKTARTLEALKGGKLGAAGGIAAVAGTVCSVRAVNDKWHEIQFVKVFEPVIRLAMDLITIGGQGMSGEDFSAEQLGYESKKLDELGKTGKEKGKVISSFNESATYKADVDGKKGGTELKKEDADQFTAKAPGYISWASDGRFDDLCSTGGVIVTTGISAIVGVLSGGIASTATGILAGVALGPAIIDKVVGLISGSGIKTEDASGADLMNFASMGGRAAGSGIAQQSGATRLSDEEEKELRTARLQDDRQELAEKGFAYRLFNPYDSRTLAAKAVDNTPNSVEGFVSVVAKLPNTLASVFTAPFKFLSSAVFAQERTDGYDYPFPKYGFSQENLDNPLVQDPFDNAEKAGALLNSNNENGVPDYIKRAKNCFGVGLMDGPEGWDIEVPEGTPEGVTKTYDDSWYKKNKCGEKSDNWLRIRFFMLDTGVMTAWACLQDDKDACSQLGFEAAATSDESSSASAGECGDSKTVAQEILDDNSITGIDDDADVLSDLKNTAAGKPAYSNVPINPNLLCFLRDLGLEGDLTIEDITGAGSGHSPGSNHYKGIAVDIRCVGLGLNIPKMEKIAKRHNGANNGELCDRPNPYGYPLHNHYDFSK